MVLIQSDWGWAIFQRMSKNGIIYIYNLVPWDFSSYSTENWLNEVFSGPNTFLYHIILRFLPGKKVENHGLFSLPLCFIMQLSPLVSPISFPSFLKVTVNLKNIRHGSLLLCTTLFWPVPWNPYKVFDICCCNVTSERFSVVWMLLQVTMWTKLERKGKNSSRFREVKAQG